MAQNYHLIYPKGIILNDGKVLNIIDKNLSYSNIFVDNIKITTKYGIGNSTDVTKSFNNYKFTETKDGKHIYNLIGYGDDVQQLIFDKNDVYLKYLLNINGTNNELDNNLITVNKNDYLNAVENTASKNNNNTTSDDTQNTNQQLSIYENSRPSTANTEDTTDTEGTTGTTGTKNSNSNLKNKPKQNPKQTKPQTNKTPNKQNPKQKINNLKAELVRLGNLTSGICDNDNIIEPNTKAICDERKEIEKQLQLLLKGGKTKKKSKNKKQNQKKSRKNRK